MPKTKNSNKQKLAVANKAAKQVAKSSKKPKKEKQLNTTQLLATKLKVKLKNLNSNKYFGK